MTHFVLKTIQLVLLVKLKLKLREIGRLLWSFEAQMEICDEFLRLL
jgi:hypothetical protein